MGRYVWGALLIGGLALVSSPAEAQYWADFDYSDFDLWYQEYQLADAWNSWWAMEWANALGDNYPAPEYVDAYGNYYYEDAYGYLHDYYSGMSDVEWGSIEASIYGLQKAYPVGRQSRVPSRYQAATDVQRLQDTSARVSPRLKAPHATRPEHYVGAHREA
ncbi:MAG: hypothetical protein RMK16_08750, partial [Acidobacteriota bacterium]|nr:hypothetical protein [Acidobacteriota bacterium]